MPDMSPSRAQARRTQQPHAAAKALPSGLRIIERRIADLRPAEYNPRQLTADQYEALKASLERFGFVDPVIVNVHRDRANVIIGGHQRLRCWADLGHDTAPCVEVSLPRDRERELNVRLNRNVGEWDWDALANQFDIPELIEWGFDKAELGEQDTDLGLGEPTDRKNPVLSVKLSIPPKTWLVAEEALRAALDALAAEYGLEVDYP